MLATAKAAVAAWCDAHLVPEWRHFWKLRSVQLAGLAGLIGAYFSDPGNASQWVYTLSALPPEVRRLIQPAVFMALAFVPTMVRLWMQGRKSGG